MLKGLGRLYNRWVLGYDNPLIGRVLELRGNLVSFDGCAFDISSPVITTEAKSWFAFDRYEKPERRAVERYLDPRLPVIELGGAVGVLACVTNRRLSQPDRHIVVEANPDLIPILSANRERNGCTFTVVNRAVNYAGEEVEFFRYTNFLGSSTRPITGVPVRVPATTLRALHEESGFDRFTLICDIEGAETELVSGDAELLRDRAALLIIELHPWLLGTARTEGLLSELANMGFVLLHTRDDTYVLRNTHLTSPTADA